MKSKPRFFQPCKTIELRFFNGFTLVGTAKWITDCPVFDGNSIQTFEAWILDFDNNGHVCDIDVDEKRYNGVVFRFDHFHMTQKPFIVLNCVSRKELIREKKRLSKWLKELENLSTCQKCQKFC